MPLVSLPMPEDDAPAAPAASDNRMLDIEALFSAVGLGPILAAHPTLHKYQLRAAAALPRELRRRILAFVSSDAFTEGKDVPEFDYDSTLKTVSAGRLDDKQSKALLRAVPDFAEDFAVQVNKIMAWANPILPRDSRPAVIGDRPAEPDPHTLADFRRVWQVALDPMIVLDDLADGSLSDDQVSALQLIYPAFYDELRQAITEEMGAMEGRKGKNWEPAPQKAAMLGMIMGTQRLDPEMTAAVQQVYAAHPDAKPMASAAGRRRSSGGGGDIDAATPGQQAGSGMSSAG